MNSSKSHKSPTEAPEKEIEVAVSLQKMKWKGEEELERKNVGT